jgi:hypothetical protein
MSFKDFGLNFEDFKKMLIEEDNSIVDVQEEISGTYRLSYTIEFTDGRLESYYIDNTGQPRLICKGEK